MLTEIKTTLEILKEIPSLKNLFPDNSTLMKEKEERMVVLRAYLAEVQHNEEILKVIANGCKKEETYNKLKVVASLLENSVGALIVYGSSKGEIKDIQELSKIQIKIDEMKNSEKSENGDEFVVAKTLEEAICFCTLRIDVLKSLAAISEDNHKFFKTINLTRRLKNIQKYTNQIKRTLEMNLNSYSEGSVI